MNMFVFTIIHMIIIITIIHITVIIIIIIITWWRGLCGQTSCLRDRQGPTRSASISQSEHKDDDYGDDDGDDDLGGDGDGDGDDDHGGDGDSNLLDVRDLEVGEDVRAVAASDHIVAWRVAPGGNDHDGYSIAIMIFFMVKTMMIKMMMLVMRKLMMEDLR